MNSQGIGGCSLDFSPEALPLSRGGWGADPLAMRLRPETASISLV